MCGFLGKTAYPPWVTTVSGLPLALHHDPNPDVSVRARGRHGDVQRGAAHCADVLPPVQQHGRLFDATGGPLLPP